MWQPLPLTRQNWIRNIVGSPLLPAAVGVTPSACPYRRQPLTSTDQLLIDLGFNPSTKNRYSDSSGTEIIGETNRSLQIKSNGDILYQSGGDPAVEIDSSDDTPSPAGGRRWFRRPAAEAPG